MKVRSFEQAFTRATLALNRHDANAKFLGFKRYSMHPEDHYLYVALVQLNPRKFVVWGYNDSVHGECGYFNTGDYFAVDHYEADEDGPDNALAAARQRFSERERKSANHPDVLTYTATTPEDMEKLADAMTTALGARLVREAADDEPTGHSCPTCGRRRGSAIYADRCCRPDDEADGDKPKGAPQVHPKYVAQPFPKMPGEAWQRDERDGRAKIHLKTRGPFHAVDIYLPADSKGWQLYDHSQSAQVAADRLGIALARTIYAFAHDLADADTCREFMSAQLDRYAKFGAADSEGFITAATYAERALGTMLGLR